MGSPVCMVSPHPHPHARNNNYLYSELSVPRANLSAPTIKNHPHHNIFNSPPDTGVFQTSNNFLSLPRSHQPPFNSRMNINVPRKQSLSRVLFRDEEESDTEAEHVMSSEGNEHVEDQEVTSDLSSSPSSNFMANGLHSMRLASSPHRNVSSATPSCHRTRSRIHMSNSSFKASCERRKRGSFIQSPNTNPFSPNLLPTSSKKHKGCSTPVRDEDLRHPSHHNKVAPAILFNGSEIEEGDLDVGSEGSAASGHNNVSSMENPFSSEGEIDFSTATSAHRGGHLNLLSNHSSSEFDMSSFIHADPESRLNLDFADVETVGKGCHSTVYRVTNRIDGMVYAVKRSTKWFKGQNREKFLLNEMYGYSILCQHPRTVFYYGGWMDDDHVYIQLEYCRGGSLMDVINYMRTHNKRLPVRELRRILKQLLQGLAAIHNKGISHMDIKPENIFLTQTHDVDMFIDRKQDNNPYEYFDEDEYLDADAADEDLLMELAGVQYKYGDFGLVCTRMEEDCREGDSRYMALEMLNMLSVKDCFKADIFSLGVTMLHIITMKDKMPTAGPEWQAIRHGDAFNDPELLKKMLSQNPQDRPDPLTLLKSPALANTSWYLDHQFRENRQDIALQGETIPQTPMGNKTNGIRFPFRR